MWLLSVPFTFQLKSRVVSSSRNKSLQSFHMYVLRANVYLCGCVKGNEIIIYSDCTRRALSKYPIRNCTSLFLFSLAHVDLVFLLFNGNVYGVLAWLFEFWWHGTVFKAWGQFFQACLWALNCRHDFRGKIVKKKRFIDFLATFSKYFNY